MYRIKHIPRIINVVEDWKLGNKKKGIWDDRPHGKNAESPLVGWLGGWVDGWFCLKVVTMMIFSFSAIDTHDCTAIHSKPKPCDRVYSGEYHAKTINWLWFHSLYTYGTPIESNFYRLNRYIYRIALSAVAKTVVRYVYLIRSILKSSHFEIRSYDLRDDFERNKRTA